MAAACVRAPPEKRFVLPRHLENSSARVLRPHFLHKLTARTRPPRQSDGAAPDDDAALADPPDADDADTSDDEDGGEAHLSALVSRLRAGADHQKAAGDRQSDLKLWC